MLDTFINLCDQTTGKESMILGSCQVSFIHNGVPIQGARRNWTLQKLFMEGSELKANNEGGDDGSEDESTRPIALQHDLKPLAMKRQVKKTLFKKPSKR